MSDPLIARSDRIAKRRQYTGESSGTVRRQLREDPGPLMPVPTSQEQLELEGAVLRAWMRALNRRPCYPATPTSACLITQTRVATSMITLEIDQGGLHGFLAESLPMKTGGEITGIPGLRPSPARTHLDLVLVGVGGRTDAIVRLHGVTKEGWRVAERCIGQYGMRLWPTGLNELHNDEIAALRNRTTKPTAVLSAMLRRLPIWREASWLDVRANDVALCLYWRGGPTASRVTEMFEDPVCGVTGVTMASRQMSDVVRCAVFVASAATRHGKEILDAALSEAASNGEPARTHVHRPLITMSSLPIPCGMWDLQEMRDALARREICSVYRLLRRQGVSQRQIAALTGQSQSEVSEILKGRQVRAYDVLTRIASGLDIPREYMGLAYDETTAVRVAAAADILDIDDDELAKRRRFLARVIASMTSDQDTAGADTPAQGDFSATEDHQAKAAVRALRALEYQYGQVSCAGTR